MAKIYNIPLNKGYGFCDVDCGGASLPVGFWTGKNMVYRDDGALIPRPSYKRKGTNGVGSSGSVKSLFLFGDAYISISNDGKPYYFLDNEWILSSWTGNGDAPSIKTPIRWGWLNGLPVFTSRDNYPMIFSPFGSSYNYLGGGIQASYIIEHQNRLLLANTKAYPSKIFYSDVGDPNSGYSENYVQVGDEMEKIAGLGYIGGNLIVLKKGSIWAKLGLYSELSSSQFQPVYYGIRPLGYSLCGRNTLFFIDVSGVVAYSGGVAQNISTPFMEEWKKRQPTPTGFFDIIMGYWFLKDWLWVITGEDFDTIWVFEVKKGRWLRFSGLNICACTSDFSPNGGFPISRYTANGDPYVYEFGVGIGGEEAEESQVEQVLQTPFLDVKNPFSVKYLKRIHLNATSVDKVEIFLRDTPHQRVTSPSYVFNPVESSKLNFTPSIPFKEISVKLTGSGKMVVSGILLEYDERRM